MTDLMAFLLLAMGHLLFKWCSLIILECFTPKLTNSYFDKWFKLQYVNLHDYSMTIFANRVFLLSLISIISMNCYSFVKYKNDVFNVPHADFNALHPYFNAPPQFRHTYTYSNLNLQSSHISSITP